MTPKQAVESLLVKEPNGEMLRFLRKEGLLNQILHPERAYERLPDGRSGSERSWSSRGGGSVDVASARGREAGRNIPSIATKPPPPEAPDDSKSSISSRALSAHDACEQAGNGAECMLLSMRPGHDDMLNFIR
jgi:hypothetical protein